MKNKHLIVIAGPTGIGKTALAIEVAQHFNTEIISADSRQFYKELNIGVARPSNEELEAVQHHFISSHSIHEPLSAGRFAHEAQIKINQLFEEKEYVVVVGGSGLFIDALIKGLDDLPSDHELKRELEEKFREEGIEYLQTQLLQLDTDYFKTVDTHNPHRLIRAIEVCKLTGKTYSELRKGIVEEPSYSVQLFVLDTKREFLYERINIRVDKMMERGLEEEAKQLYSLKHLTALNTVGYKELFDYFDGVSSKEYAIEKIKQHSRNYAKRQITWWKRDQSAIWIDPLLPTSLLSQLISKIKN